ncbi:unnamed protein product, partial [Brassica oleracea]
FYFDTTIPAIEAFTERTSWESICFPHTCHSLQLHLQPPYLHCVLLDPLTERTEAERAPGGDVHT